MGLQEELEQVLSRCTDSGGINDGHPDYEHGLTKFVNSAGKKYGSQEFLTLIKSNIGSDLEYAAFYCLNIRYRSEQNLSQLEKLLQEYGTRFQNRPTFSHLRTLYRLERESNKESSYEDLLICSQRDRKAFPDNPGIVHLMADTAATIFEKLSGDQLAVFLKTWLEPAIEAVDSAIAIKPDYAKYYCTKARLLTFEHRYEDANVLIDIAIDKEDSSRADYVSRINYYERHRMSIANHHNRELLTEKIEQNEKEISRQFEAYEAKLQDANIKSIELLGLFSGIIGFIVGSITIAANQSSLADAARLIIVLMGSTLCVYSAFSFLIHKTDKATVLRCACTLAVGLITIAGGLFLCSRL